MSALKRNKVLDTPPEPRFDELVQLASEICETPIALISLVDKDRQWFKSRVGLDALETPRNISFCGHAIVDDGPFIVGDAARDPRFSENPLVTGDPKIRFYAGSPLVTTAGHALGTLCVIDRIPRVLTMVQQRSLEVLSRQVTDQLQLRLTLSDMGRVQEQLERSNRELDQYALIVSHDLKEPLRAVRSFAGLLRSDFGGDLGADGMKYLDFIQHGADRMHHMVHDLLDYARAGAEELEMEPVALGPLIKLVLETLASQIDETAAQVTVASLPTVMGRASQIHQVFQNLIGNAIKFSSGAQPRVEIGVVEGSGGEVFVRDHGIGMESRHLANIFRPFLRLHREDYEGTGIGLAVVQKVMEHHRGGVRVESSPGQGSTFYLTFKMP